MQAYQGHASVSYPHGSLMTWTAMERGGFLINREGRRFVDESLGYSGCAAHVLAQPDNCALAIIDGRMRTYLETHVPDFVSIAQHGGVKSGQAIDELATACRVDGVALGETLAGFNAAARGEAPDALGRTAFGVAPLEPPFSAVRVTAGLFHTQGGLDVDTNAQPVRQDGAPIGNLYAVGGVAVGVSGADGGRGYCSANGLLAALGLGRVAGRHAARHL
jgi:fumarate reductase flavoprotein subunit